jgi:hypothetical protein
MTTITVKRFIRRFTPQGGAIYSIRRRSDGVFQIYHDNPFEGINQPYQFEDKPVSGLYADFPSAEKELLRVHPDVEILEAGQ